MDSKNKLLCSSQQKFSIFMTPRFEFPSTWGQLSPRKDIPQYAQVFSNHELLLLGSYKLLNLKMADIFNDMFYKNKVV